MSLVAGAKIIQLSGDEKHPLDYLTLVGLTLASWAGFSVIAFTIGKAKGRESV